MRKKTLEDLKPGDEIISYGPVKDMRFKSWQDKMVTVETVPGFEKTIHEKDFRKNANLGTVEADYVPCPFCHSDNIKPANTYGFPVEVSCGNCGAAGPPMLTAPEAKTAWNTRK